jgi:hypothetical protein
MEKDEIEKKALAFAESKERAGCAYFNGLYRGFIAGYEACGDEMQASNCINPAVHSWTKKYYEDGDYAMQCNKCGEVR